MKKEATQELAVELLETLQGYGDVFHNAAYKIYGISDWFKAFIQSEAFRDLEPNYEAEAFETYKLLHWILQHLDDTVPVK